MIQKLLGALLSLFCATALCAQTILLTVDGTFSDSQSGLISGTREVTISLNKNADLFVGNVGTELWKEILPNVRFSSGFMSVELGRLTPIKPDYFLDPSVIFIVRIAGVDGRVGIPVRYVPLAVRSEVANTALRVSGNAIEGAIPASLVTGTLSGVTGLGPLVTTLSSSEGLLIGTRTLFANPRLGRVGVGTSLPAHALDVSGNVRVTGQLIFSDGSTLSSALSLATTGGGPVVSTTDVTLEADTDVNFSGRIVAKVSNVERFVILNDGKVGVGTTRPIQELEVNGGLLVRNTNISNPGTIRFNGVAFEGYDGVVWRRLDIENNSAGGWVLDTSAATLTQIMPSSKVGIGISNPAYSLHVIGEVKSDYVRSVFIGDGAQVTNLNPLALSSVLPLSKGGTGVATLNINGFLYSDGTTVKSFPTMTSGQILVGTGGLPVATMLIQGRGVTINVVTSNITISHAATSTANTVTLNVGAAISGVYLDSFGHVTRMSTSNFDARYYTQSQSDSRFLGLTGGVLSGPLSFSGVTTSIQSAGSQSLVLQSGSGYVGIGMNAPAQALDVNGGLRVAYTDRGLEGTIRFDPVSRRFQGYNVNGWVALDNTTTAAGGWELSETSVYVQNSGHNVGIGTYTPRSRLHVVGTTQLEGTVQIGGALTLGSSGLYFGQHQIQAGIVSGNWSFTQARLGDIATVSAQFVGVGVATPSVPLHVVGNALITGALQTSSVVLGSRTLGAGTLVGNWLVSGTGSGTSFAVDNLTLAGNQIGVTSGVLALSGVQGITLGAALQVTGHVVTAVTNGDMSFVPYTGRVVVVDGVTFNRGVVSGLQNLVVSGSFSALEGILTVATANKNVSIGNVSPVAGVSLTVSGNVLIGAPSAVHDGAPGKSNLYVEGNVIVDGLLIQAAGGQNSFTDLETSGRTSLATASGFVGIGTTRPAATLEIRTTNNLTDRRVFSVFNTGETPLVTVTSAGLVGLSVATPTAVLHLPAGASTRAALKLTTGSLLTTNEAGAVEFDGTNLYFTTSAGTRNMVVNANSAQFLYLKTIQNSILLSNDVSGTWNTTAQLNIGGNTTYPVTVLAKDWRVDALGVGTFTVLTSPSLNIGSSMLLANTSGVGIGTSPLAGKLHVVGNTVVGPASVLIGGQLNKSNLYVEGDVVVQGRFEQPQTAARSDLARVQVYGATQLATVSGNVSVGTPTATATLEIKATANTTAARPFRIRSGETTPIMTVLGDGKIGVGTDVPSSSLHVVGTINATYFVGNGAGIYGLDPTWSQNADLSIRYMLGVAGVGQTNPQALLHVGAASTTTPSFMLTTATALLTVPKVGSLEYYNETLYFTPNSGGRQAIVLGTATQNVFNKVLDTSTLSGTTAVTGRLSAINWDIGMDGRGLFGRALVDNLAMDGSTIGSIDNLNLTASSSVVIKEYFEFSRGTPHHQLRLTQGDLALFASSGVVGIEGVTFNAGVVSGIGDLGVSGSIRVESGSVTLTSSPLSVNSGLYVGTNGRVGVGTTAPNTTLQVIGTVNATYFSGDGSGLVNLDPTWTQNSDLTMYYNKNKVGLGVTNPLALLHIAAGTVSTPSLRINQGTLTSVSVPGAIEYNGSGWYVSDTSARRQLATLDGVQTLTGTSLNNPTINGVLYANMVEASAWSVSSLGAATFSQVSLGGLTATAGRLSSSVATLSITAANDLRLMNLVLSTDNRLYAPTAVLRLGQVTDTVSLAGITLNGTTLTGVTGLTMTSGQLSGVNSLSVSGAASVGGPVVLSGGDLRLPVSTVVSTSSNVNLSFVLPTGVVGITANRLVINNTSLVIENGRMGIGTVPNSTDMVSVVGTVNATRFVGDGSGLTNLSVDSVWRNQTATQIKYTSGNVAIGRETASGLLHLGAGTTAVAPFIFSPGGALLATPVEGALEYLTALYYTDATARRTVVNTDTAQTLSGKTLIAPVITSGMTVSGSVLGTGWGVSTTGNATVSLLTVGRLVLSGTGLSTATSDLVIAPGSGRLSVSDYLHITSGNGTLGTLRFTTNGQLVSDTGILALGVVTVNAGAVSGVTSLQMAGALSGPTSLALAGPLSGVTTLFADSIGFANRVTLNATGLVSTDDVQITVSAGKSIRLLTSASGEVMVTANRFRFNQNLFVVDAATGRVGVGSEPSLDARLVVAGTVNATAFVGDGSGLFNLDSVWKQDVVKNLYYVLNGVGIGVITPQAWLHLAAGTTTTPSLVLAPAVALTETLREGAVEYHSGILYITDSTTRRPLVTTTGTQTLTAKTLSAATLSGTTTATGPLTASGWSVATNGTAQFQTVSGTSASFNVLSTVKEGLTLYAAVTTNIQNAFAFRDDTQRQLVVSNGDLALFARDGVVVLEGVTFNAGAVSGVSSLSVSGPLTGTDLLLSGVLNHAAGDVRLPAGGQWTASANTNIAFTQSGTGTFGIGTTRFAINTNDLIVESGGRVGIGVVPTYQGLAVVGTVNATKFVGNGSGLTNLSSIWGQHGLNAYYLGGNVGIGTMFPSGRLHIVAGSDTTPPLALGSSAGTLLSTPMLGAIEFSGSALYVTVEEGGNFVRRSVVLQGGVQTLSNMSFANATLSGTTTVSGVMSGTGWSVSGSGAGAFASVAVGNTQLATTGLLYAGGGDLLVSSDGKVLIDTVFRFNGDTRTLQISGGDAVIESSTGALRLESVTINLGAISGVSTLAMSGDLSLGAGIRPLDNLTVTMPENKTFSVLASGTGAFAVTANRFAVNTTALVVTATGFVGVGTATPAVALDVVGTLRATTLVGNGSGITGLSSNWERGAGNVYVLERVGIGTSTALAALHVASQNGVVFTFSGTFDELSPAAIPTSGPGVYSMWYPGKAAVRAGRVTEPKATYWDAANIGLYSVAFGLNSKASQTASAVSGGEGNQVLGKYGVIAGGFENLINNNNVNYGAILGGYQNSITAGEYAAIVGGRSHSLSAADTFVGGGDGHRVSAAYGSVVGGSQNTVSGARSFVGGGITNRVSGTDALIVGGATNVVSGNYALVVGGQGNLAPGAHSLVVGGYANTAGTNSVASYASVLGGYENQATAVYSTVGGGYQNRVTGTHATVPGGDRNEANGAYSVAMGQLAKAQHSGAYVWADAQVSAFESTAANQYLIRASGGVGIGTNTPLASLHVNSTASGSRLFVAQGADARSVFSVTTSGDVGVGTLTPSVNFHVLGSAATGVVLIAPDAWDAGASELRLGESRSYTEGMSLGYDGATDLFQIKGKSNFTDYGPHLAIQKITGNVGIGTSTPVSKLTLEGVFSLRVQDSVPAQTADYGKLYYYNSNLYFKKGDGTLNNLTQVGASLWESSGNNAYYYNAVGGNLAIGTKNIESWQTYNAIQLGNTAALVFDAKTGLDDYHSVNNAYHGSNWHYKRDGASTRYTQTNGTHAFYAAATGSAASNITWTPVLFMDATGKVGIGTITPASKLDVQGTLTATSVASTVATGTAPFVVASTTMVTNLNAHYLAGKAIADFMVTSNALSEVVSVSANARQNLGLVIGTNVQAYHAALSDISGIVHENNAFIVSNGNAWMKTSGESAREKLGLAIGTNVQAYDAGLLSIAGLTTAAGKMIYTTGSDAYAVTDLTLGGRSLLAATSSANMRTLLELGSSDSVVFGNVSANGTVSANAFVGSGVGLTGVVATSIADNAVTTLKIFDANVTLAKLEAVTAGQFIVGNSSNRPTSVIMSGDATLSNAGVVTIANNAISAGKLGVNSVTTNAILDLNVTTGKLANGAVTVAKLEGLSSGVFIIGVDGTSANNTKVSMSGDATLNNAGVVTIANNAISAGKLGVNSVTTNAIMDLNVTSVKIANNAITAGKLGVDSVTTNAILNGAVTVAKMDIEANMRSHLVLATTDSVVFGAVSANGTVSANRLSVSASLVDHIATFTNADAASASSRNILMLKFSNMARPSSNHLFIDFQDSVGSLGAIRGTGTTAPALSMQDHDGYPLMMAQAKSGIRFESTGADYAEYMPKQTPKETFKDGDIVGVVEGKITRNTAKAHKSMVISMMPVVVGNMPADKDKANYALVSFVGQVYVRVLGTVNAGDYIVASGKHDGTGMAVSRDAVTREMLPLVVGQAWETTTRKAEKLVKVGITPMDIPMPVDTATNSRLSKLEKENEILREQLNILMKEVRSMKK